MAVITTADRCTVIAAIASAHAIFKQAAKPLTDDRAARVALKVHSDSELLRRSRYGGMRASRDGDERRRQPNDHADCRTELL